MKIVSIYILIVMFIGCDGGLDPTKAIVDRTDAKVRGRMIITGGKDTWPPTDSVFALRIAAFKSYPPGDILTEIVTGNAYFKFESLPLFVDSTDFILDISDPPVELKYIVAALQYADTLTAQMAVGVYTISGDHTKPSPLMVEKGKDYFIRINIDFKNLPPQPFD